eukprot:XP_003731128.1 PREDICTED: probable G-protein coupled receptor 101 [Strongylocentrotus purpuratus]
MVDTMINDHDMTSDILTSPTPYDRFIGLRIDHQPTSGVAIIEGFTLVVIFLGALTVNLIALVTTLRDEMLRRNVHNWLIINLIVNDLGITITSMSFSIVSVFDQGYFLVHNDAMCLINGIGGTGFAFGNFATIMVISLDRYLTVVWSNRFPPSKTRTIIFIILSWVLPIANIIPPTFELISDFKYHPLTHHCTPVWEVCLYYIICNIILFGVTVPVMVFCYIGVFWTLRRQQQVLRSYADENVDDSEKCNDSHQVNNPSMSLDNLSGQGGNVSETMEEFSSSNLDDPVVHGSEKGNTNRQERVKKKKKKQTTERRSLQNKLTTDKESR